MRSAAGSLHAVTKPRLSSTFPWHSRHAPVGSLISRRAHRLGMYMPLSSAASRILLPLVVLTSTPSMVSVTTLLLGLAIVVVSTAITPRLFCACACNYRYRFLGHFYSFATDLFNCNELR